jgi:hypothetical protein
MAMNDEKNSEKPGAERREDGVDLTLIRWMLSLTPEERLRILENGIRSLERLKRGTFQA